MYTRRSPATRVVIFLQSCNYQKINKFMLLQQEAVGMNFGTKSVLAVCHRWRWQKSCRSCTTVEGDGQSWLGGAYEYESHCCLGFHPALTAPVHQIGFTQQIPFRWETEERRRAAESNLTEHVAGAPTVLTLIIDQMIKADEEGFFLFFLKARAVIVHLKVVRREPPRDRYFQSRQRALLSVTLSKVITIES